MGFADIHIHSSFSFDCNTSIEVILARAAENPNLDLIAITDHDTMEGALRALKLAPRFGAVVIPGCEISTLQGHLLALFIQEPIPPGLSLVETLRRVQAQGGLGIAAHPMAHRLPSLNAAAIRQAICHPEVGQALVGIEALNAGLLPGVANPPAAALQRELGLAQTGSSDSHVAWTIGTGMTQFPGSTPADFRQALIERTTLAWYGIHRNLPRFLLSHAYHFVLHKLNWVVWTSAPGSPVQLKQRIEAHR